MLANRSPSRSRSITGTIFIGAALVAAGYAAWSLQPASAQARTNQSAQAPIAPAAVPAIDPPVGLLTPLEVKRHTMHVRAAAAGDLKVVFIGDSLVDFWHYDWGGKAVWDKTFAPLMAANFGVEGAHTKSVLWRLQNGELDGYKAKAFVVDALGIADVASHSASVAEVIQGNNAIIAEIRKRQPQAKLLLIVVPRGAESEGWVRNLTNTLATQFAGRADNQAIYFLDLRSRFIRPNGTLNAELMTNTLKPEGYAAWAKAMNPTLVQLMR
jgi:lysophospholipase L1-like esterase